MSKICKGAVIAATGNGYVELFRTGADVAVNLFGLAKDKYDEQWLMRVLILDKAPETEQGLSDALDSVYKEDEKKQPAFQEKNWHVIHAVLDLVFRVL